jgi:hypothetical protein
MVHHLLALLKALPIFSHILVLSRKPSGYLHLCGTYHTIAMAMERSTRWKKGGISEGLDPNKTVK